MNKARLIGKYCEYCGQELNTWDDRVRKALAFDFDICENCIAEEYNINIDYLRKVMSDRPSFKHNGKTIRSICYVADFTFKDKDGQFHIVDVKGSKNTLTDVYKLKKKMMQYKGFDIEKV